MGRSVDHLLTDCYLGQLSPYLNISIWKAFPCCTNSKINPLQKKRKIRMLMKRKLPVRITKNTDKYKPQRTSKYKQITLC